MSAQLVAFLRARLDEDERVARAAEGEHWEASGNLYEGETNNPIAIGPWGMDLDETAEHIARHDPARVLADIAAKRALLDLHHEKTVWIETWTPDGDRCQEPDYVCAECEDETPCKTVRFLALPFDQHLDYREEWRP